jgi:hypothetical protein
MWFAISGPSIFAICVDLRLAICGPSYFLRIQNFRKSAKIHNFSPYKYKLEMLSFKFKDGLLAFGTVLRQSYKAIRSIKYSYGGEEIL